MKKYLDGNFSKWILEDIENVYKAREKYLEDETNNYNYYLLKKAIWLLSLTIKSEVITGEMSVSKAEELKEYFWGLLLW